MLEKKLHERVKARNHYDFPASMDKPSYPEELRNSKYHYSHTNSPSLSKEQWEIARVFVIYAERDGWCGIAARDFFESIAFGAHLAMSVFQTGLVDDKASWIQQLLDFFPNCYERLSRWWSGTEPIRFTFSSSGGVGFEKVGITRHERRQQEELKKNAQLGMKQAYYSKRKILQHMIKEGLLYDEMSCQSGELIEQSDGSFSRIHIHEALFPTEKFTSLILQDIERLVSKNVECS